jgi:hypothetical protein
MGSTQKRYDHGSPGGAWDFPPPPPPPPPSHDPKHDPKQDPKNDPTGDSNSNSNHNTNANCNTNDLDNKIDNHVSNCVDNTVSTHVNVDVCLTVDESGLSSPVIDLSNLNMAQSFGSLIMPDVVNQNLTDHSNAFNIDQVNNLVDNDVSNGASVTFNGGGGGSELACDPWHQDSSSPAGFNMDAKIHSGDSSIDGTSNGAASSADATLNQDAFTQTITQGANIQFNSLTIQAAGDHIQDDHSLGS